MYGQELDASAHIQDVCGFIFVRWRGVETRQPIFIDVKATHQLKHQGQWLYASSYMML